MIVFCNNNYKPSKRGDELLFRHVLHLVHFFGIICDLIKEPFSLVGISVNGLNALGDKSLQMMRLVTGKLVVAVEPQYLSAAKSYARAAFSSLSYPPALRIPWK